MILEALPADILALVLDGDLSWASIELWKSGNRILMSKMMNGGITDVVLSAHSWNNRTVWPECLKHFRLRSLRIKTVRSPLSFLQLREELKQLHRGLERLELEGHGVTQAFILASKSVLISSPLPSLQPPSIALGSGSSGSKPSLNLNWDMNATHPKLTSLKLASKDPASKIGFARLDFGSYALLPRSLTHLDVSGTQFVLDKDDTGNFPPELASLELNEDLAPQLTADDLLCLPSSLTRLPNQLTFSESALLAIISDMTILPNLSPSVRANIKLQAALPTYYANHGKEWPDALHTLDIAMDPEKAWEIIGTSLPRRLTSFSVNTQVYPFITYDWLSSVLPLSLTTLRLLSVPWGCLSDASVWPPNLTSFELVKDHTFSINTFKLLPRTANVLKLNYGRRNEWSGTHPLPLSNVNQLDECEKELWSSIKLELLDVAKRATGCYDEARMERYILGVESGLLYGLPLATTSLSMGFMEHTPSDLRLLLPPRLTAMDWSSISLDNHLYGVLPPRLTSARFTMEGTEAVREISPYAEEALRLSNVSKLHLELLWTHTSQIPVLSKLPQGLRDFVLDAQGWRVNDTHVADLPQSISKLSLLCSLVVPEDSWSSALPRSITDLTTTFTLHGSALRYLPPLQKLSVPSIHSVTAECLQGPVPPCVVSPLCSSQLRPFGRPSWTALYNELRERKRRSALQ